MSANKTRLEPTVSSHVKKSGGGMAVGGGVSVQAIATAIVGVHILSGVKLDWLKGICVDIPTAVWAESEGPGDDLRIELGDAGIIEVQVKKGLKGGSKLWTALLSLAREIYSKNLPYGVLVVA